MKLVEGKKDAGMGGRDTEEVLNVDDNDDAGGRSGPPVSLGTRGAAATPNNVFIPLRKREALRRSTHYLLRVTTY